MEYERKITKYNFKKRNYIVVLSCLKPINYFKGKAHLSTNRQLTH
jgi:hypothetical protein